MVGRTPPAAARDARHRRFVRRLRRRRRDTPSFRELYGGVVAVSTDDPGIAWVTARPGSTCGSRKRRVRHTCMTVTSDRTDYRVTIDLTVSEDGQELWSRAMGPQIPRDLA